MRPCTPNYAKHNLGTPSIDLLLGLVKAFTMYTFVKLRKRPDDLEGEPMPELEKASGYEKSAPSIDREEAIPNHETSSESLHAHRAPVSRKIDDIKHIILPHVCTHTRGPRTPERTHPTPGGKD